NKGLALNELARPAHSATARCKNVRKQRSCQDRVSSPKSFSRAVMHRKDGRRTCPKSPESCGGGHQDEGRFPICPRSRMSVGNRTPTPNRSHTMRVSSMNDRNGKGWL